MFIDCFRVIQDENLISGMISSVSFVFRHQNQQTMIENLQGILYFSTALAITNFLTCSFMRLRRGLSGATLLTTAQLGLCEIKNA